MPEFLSVFSERFPFNGIVLMRVDAVSHNKKWNRSGMHFLSGQRDAR
jgi:hypothetical protein